MLKFEVLDTGADTDASRRYFVAVFSRLMQDGQERLAFLAHRFITSHIQLFSPSASDLDYPGRLMRQHPAHTAHDTRDPVQRPTAR